VGYGVAMRTMRVKELMTRDPKTCSPETPLSTAARTMAAENCGVLPVVVEERCVGIVTDRDVCLAIGNDDAPPSARLVADTMTRGIHFARADDPIGRALQLMRRWRVRRLPVLAADGRLEGILSLGDVALRIGADFPALPTLGEDVARTLQAISERQRPAPPAPSRRSRIGAAPLYF